MGYRTPNHKPGMFYKRQFKYDAYRNEYVCPQGQALPYSTTNRLGYREYKSNAQICGRCPVRSQCTNSAIAVKVVTRHVWERAKERVDARRLTEWGQRIYARRKQTVERSFADAKQLHGHRYARMRGLRKVAEQCLLAAAAQNIKKIAMLLARKRKKGASGSRLALRAHAAASGERFALQLRLPARGEPAILIPERQNPTLTKTWGSSAV
ncbi:transposase DDE domain protein [Burkholderia mallei]|nr:transposase DDE domain protein [Burkholderia mallei]